MAGIFLTGFVVLGAVFILISLISSYYYDEWRIAGICSLVLAVFMVISIPVSRLDTRKKVECLRVMQLTLDANRQSQAEFNVFERQSVIKTINKCNQTIATWKITGDKWYLNKWYLDPATQDVAYLK